MTRAVLHILSGDLYGGSEAQMVLQLPALIAQGWRVTALLFNDRDTASRFREAHVPTVICDEACGFLSLIKNVTDEVKRASPQLIVAHGYKEAIVGGLVSRKLDIPLILTFHGLTESYRGFKRFKAGVYHWLETLVATRRASALIAVNRSLADALGISNDRRTHLVSNVAAIASEALEQNQEPEFLRPAVVVVGRLAPVKRFDRAIRVIRRMHEIVGDTQLRPHLYIVGDGPDRAALEAQKSSLNLDDFVHFCGFQRNATRYIANADLLMISSDSEGMPTILLEALLAGTPVVSTRIPGIEEVAAEYPGFPIAFSDKTDVSLSEATLRALLNSQKQIDPKLQQQITERVSPSRAARELEEIYLHILAPKT